MEGKAIAVVFPYSSTDVSKIVRYAYNHDLKIYPQGSTSELVGSSTPHTDGIILSFERMNRIKETNLIDSYVVVEPGVKIFELNNHLAKDGYMFPIDPASVKIASVGGAINSGSGGMQGAKYGSIRDWVLELEVVIPDEGGSILRLGSKTSKSRQGYDLVRLIVGSEGTLALVTEATLKITPIPENTVIAAAFFDSLEDLMNSVIEIKKRRMDILLMEFVEDKSVDIAIKMLGSKATGTGHYLLVGVNTAVEARSRVMKSLAESMKLHNSNRIYTARSMSEAEKMGLFDIRRNYYLASIRLASESRSDPLSGIKVYVEDISVPPSRLVEAVKRLRGLSEKYNLPMTLAGHIGDGNLHPVVWIEEKDESKREALVNMVGDIMMLALELGGTVSSEHGIGLTKKEGLIMEFNSKESSKAIELMKKIKRLFDPKGILNPDKMFIW
jgi:glycolate oxidase